MHEAPSPLNKRAIIFLRSTFFRRSTQTLATDKRVRAPPFFARSLAGRDWGLVVKMFVSPRHDGARTEGVNKRTYLACLLCSVVRFGTMRDTSLRNGGDGKMFHPLPEFFFIENEIGSWGKLGSGKSASPYNPRGKEGGK